MSTYLAFIGSLGTPEIIGIIVVLLLLFGAKKLPELARGVGKSMGEFKKAKNEFERELLSSESEAQKPAATETKPAPGSEPKA